MNSLLAARSWIVVATAAALLCALFLFAAACVSIVLERISRRRRLDSLAEVARRANPTLIVALGCPPRTPSGRPNRHLIGRATAAAAAFHHLREVPVLCSGRIVAPGPGESEGADEAEALATLLEVARVPRTSIRFDRRAARTIDTIDHLTEHHRDDRILIATQAFHLPRALFLARAQGLEAFGLAAPGPTPGWRGQLREGLARMRAVWDVGIRWIRR